MGIRCDVMERYSWKCQHAGRLLPNQQGHQTVQTVSFKGLQDYCHVLEIEPRGTREDLLLVTISNIAQEI